MCAIKGSPLAEQQRKQETNMSLDITSHAGRPVPDELVPSRYALRVGEIDVLVIRADSTQIDA